MNSFALSFPPRIAVATLSSLALLLSPAAQAIDYPNTTLYSPGIASDPTTVADVDDLLETGLTQLYNTNYDTVSKSWMSIVGGSKVKVNPSSNSVDPGAACASLWYWGYYLQNNYQNNPTATWLLQTAKDTFNAYIDTHLQPDGSLYDPSLPAPERSPGISTQFFGNELGPTFLYLSAAGQLDAATKAKWTSVLQGAVTYLINNGDIPPYPLGTNPRTWYANGNIVLGFTGLLYYTWRATGQQRYKDQMDTEYNFTLYPTQLPPGVTAWNTSVPLAKFGIRFDTQPQRADGADGSAYLVESNGTNYGYDGDYTSLQAGIAARLYSFSQDVRFLYLANLETNKMMANTDQETWVTDATGGSRHSLWDGDRSACLPTLAWMTGSPLWATKIAPPSGQYTRLDSEYHSYAFQPGGYQGSYGGWGANVGTYYHVGSMWLRNSAQNPSVVPGQPTSLVGAAGAAQARLTWAQTPGCGSFTLKRSTASGGLYSTVYSGGTNAFWDNTVVNGVTYYYVVSASNGAGESVNSAQISVVPVAGAPTAVPAKLRATAYNAAVVLDWSPTPNATSYSLFKATSASGPWNQVNGIYGNTYTWSGPNVGAPWATLTNGTTYYFKVCGINASGTGPSSAVVSTVPIAPPAASPTGLTATPGPGQVTLHWNATAGATSYGVFSNTAPTNMVRFHRSLTTTSYTWTGLTSGQTYYWKVYGMNAVGQGPDSAVISAVAQ